MQKFRKFFVYKKYSEEVWGKLLLKKFSYTKKKVCLKYKKNLFKWVGLNTMFKYFKNSRLFLKRLKWIGWVTKKFFLNKVLLPNKLLFEFQAFGKVKNFRLSKQVISILPGTKFLKQSLPTIFRLLCNNGISFTRYNSTHFKKFYLRNTVKFLLSKPLKVRRSKTFFYAIFQISPRKIEERKSLYYYKYAYYKKFSVFYGFRAVSIFVKYCSSIFRNNINYSSFFLRLGCKLDYLLFCLNFFPSIYFIQKFIAGKNVYINNMTISNFHHVVGLNEIVSFNRKYFCLLYDYLIKNLLLRRVFVNVPNYIEVDYKLLVVLVCTLPSPSSINKPFTSGGQPFTPYRW